MSTLGNNRDMHSARVGSLPAVVSTVVVLPFMILEWMNRPNLWTDFPIPLFGLMWVLAFSFILVARPIVRDLRTRDEKRVASVVSFVPKLAFLILVAWCWLALVGDQMPCFLGVPNCD